MKKGNIGIVGAGSIGTALGNALAEKKDLDVNLYSIEEDVVQSINTKNVNNKYFPHIKLNKGLKAHSSLSNLSDSEIVFLALPSTITIDYLNKISKNLNEESPLVNLAKGFGNGNKTIGEMITENYRNPSASFKGPTFARELIENSPTAFTYASEDQAWFQRIEELFEQTNIYVDFSTDLKGVELLSILKNIYAIVVGITDARFDSPNLRFMILTKAFKELKSILLQFGGKEESLFNYCGFGDFAMTALNDLSRNRTLGLFIGKGFFTKDISNEVLLEGKIATQIFCEEISKANKLTDYQIIYKLYRVFNYEMTVTEFIESLFAR